MAHKVVFAIHYLRFTIYDSRFTIDDETTTFRHDSRLGVYRGR
jgi:hypothetical protein